MTDVLAKAQAWANNTYFSPAARQEIADLLAQNNEKELTERFYKDLEFGTGGIRSIIGMGLNRINIYTIRKATAALATVLKKHYKKLPEIKVAISFDSRHFSQEFATETACTLAAYGIHSYIYRELHPVALLSFAVRYHHTQAGVMVTASHNPPEYNGYKVYGDDGAQVIAPLDQEIINAYNKIQDFQSLKTLSLKEAEAQGLIHWLAAETEEAYQNAIAQKAIDPDLCQQHGSEIKIVYTPLHGTGLKPVTAALKRKGFTNVLLVDEQCTPDGRFPTVKSPNPENPEALALGVALMQKENADVVFGTDPDADRIGVAVNHHGQVVYLTGNQIGTIMLFYICHTLAVQNKLPLEAYAVKSIVTTPLQEAICQRYGVTMENTLTGFKWICGKMRACEQNEPQKVFLFATEESFGYLNHPFVRDKDGIAPLTLLAEITLAAKRQGQTLVDYLYIIYREFGYYAESLLNLNYQGKEGAEKIKRIMDYFRQQTPADIGGDTIIALADYQAGKIKALQKEGQACAKKIELPASNVLEFIFASGNLLFLRPSGTEPKIKFYAMIKENRADLATNQQLAQQKIDELFNFIKKTVDPL